MTRLWVDANVILRFLTGDPPEMAQKAARLMARAEKGKILLVVSVLVLAEVFWVLKSFYGYRRAEIARTLLLFLSAPGIEVGERDLIVRAIELTRTRNVDFADAWLALQAARRGEKVCTFDETDFKRLPVEWCLPGASIR